MTKHSNKHCYVILHSDTWCLGKHFCETLWEVIIPNHFQTFAEAFQNDSNYILDGVQMKWAWWLVHMICVFLLCTHHSLQYVQAFLRVCFASFERMYFLRFLCAPWIFIHFKALMKNMWMEMWWFLLKIWWIYLKPTVFKCHMSLNETGKKSNHYLRWIGTETEHGLMLFSSSFSHSPQRRHCALKGKLYLLQFVQSASAWWCVAHGKHH